MRSSQKKTLSGAAGLRFKLPALENSIGLLGLPKRQKAKLEKVA
jgi:hypothetical protein